MPAKAQQFVPKGMKRDYSASKADPQFSFANHNIRITAREDATLLSITNEKGNSPIVFAPDPYNKIIIEMTYDEVRNETTIKGAPERPVENITGKVTIDFIDEDGEINNDSIFFDEDGEIKGVWDGHYIFVSAYYSGDDSERRIGDSIVYAGEDKEEYPLFPGLYVGHCILNNILILFLQEKNKSFIISLEENNGIFRYENLYLGDLGLDPKFPIETLGVYENEDIQKIYWVDGIHQPRMINIKDPHLADTAPFDFVGAIVPGINVTINPNSNGGGDFPSGVVQYVLTFSNMYGSESHPIYVSELFYTAPENRGGNPEEKSTTSFDINMIPSLDNRGSKYIRIYSIVRTSLNSTPTTKLVAVLPIGTEPISFTDRNTTGSNVDPTELLYKGGEPIHPYTMAHKDGTLFLGNYTVEVTTISEEIREELKKDSSISFWSKEVDIAIPTEGLYPYINTLNKSSEVIKTFHGRECYRFGIQLLNKTGVWSEVLYLGDARVEIPTSDPLSPASFNIEQGEKSLKLIKAVASLPITTINKLSDNIIGVRGVVVYPSAATREVVCQGIVCPTVYSAEGRLTNTPFAQSSWFSRPNLQYATPDSFPISSEGALVNSWESRYRYMNKVQIQNSHLATVVVNPITLKAAAEGETSVTITPPIGGTWREFRHNMHLPSTLNRNGEIQYMDTFCEYNATAEAAQAMGGTFFVDQSIVTLHSPEIELSDSLFNTDLSDVKFRIVGYCQVTGNLGDMTIIASPGGRYIPHLFTVGSTSKSAVRSTNATPSWHAGNIGWMVYPWHRTGSLDDSGIPTAGEARTSDLEKKIISNLVFSSTTKYLTTPWKADTLYNPEGVQWSSREMLQKQRNYQGIAGAVIYKNDGNPMIKLPAPKNSLMPVDPVYYGEAKDTWYLNGNSGSETAKYQIMFLHKDGSLDFRNSYGTEPVTIKYKSTPHIVIVTNNTLDQDQLIMPTLHELEDGAPATTVTPFPRPINSRSLKRTTTLLPFWMRKYNELRPIITFKKHTSEVFSTSEYLSASYVWWVEGAQLYQWVSESHPAGSFGPEVSSAYYTKRAVDPGTIYTEINEKDNYYAVYDNLFGRYILQKAAESDPALGSSYGVYQDSINITSDYALFWIGELYRDMDISDRFGGTSENALRENKWEVCGKTHFFGEKVTWKEELVVDIRTSANQILSYAGNSKYANKTIMVKDTGTGEFNNKIVHTGINTTTRDWFLEAPKSETLYKVINDGNYKWSGSFYNVDVSVEYTEGDTFYQRYDCLKTYAYSDKDLNAVVDIVSFLCETRINIDGRYDKNRGNLNNLTASPDNFNLINPVYSQSNSFFPNQYIEADKYSLSRFPNSITWSKTKLSGEEVDSWTEFTLLSTMDMDGDKGGIEALRRFNNEIYCFQPLGISRIFFNSHAQMLTQGEGTGVLPVELMNSGKVEGKSYLTNGIGSSNKWSIVTTPMGMYFIDNLTNSLQLFTQEGLSDLSDRLSFRIWADEINSMNKWNPIDFSNAVAFYDSTNSDVYFVTNSPNTTLAYSELLGQFTSFYDYDNVPLMFSLNGRFYSFKNGQVWVHGAGEYNSFFGVKKPYSIEVICNMDEPLDKIFNSVEWRATVKVDGKDSTSTFNKIQVTTDGEYQDTGLQSITNRVNSPVGGFFQGSSPVLRRKFRMWRIPIPRDASNGRDRIRGPWAKIKLSKEGTPTEGGPNNEKMELHDMVVHFFE